MNRFLVALLLIINSAFLNASDLNSRLRLASARRNEQRNQRIATIAREAVAYFTLHPNREDMNLDSAMLRSNHIPLDALGTELRLLNPNLYIQTDRRSGASWVVNSIFENEAEDKRDLLDDAQYKKQKKSINVFRQRDSSQNPTGEFIDLLSKMMADSNNVVVETPTKKRKLNEKEEVCPNTPPSESIVENPPLLRRPNQIGQLAQQPTDQQPRGPVRARRVALFRN